jgi:hypothetical protein
MKLLLKVFMIEVLGSQVKTGKNRVASFCYDLNYANNHTLIKAYYEYQTLKYFDQGTKGY